jgi:type IV pilus assembly PilX-like protein
MSAARIRSLHSRPDPERGVALVMALLVLLVMALLAAVLMMSVSINRKVAGHDLRMAQALNNAEAGVSEVLARIRSGDIVLSAANPRAVGQIYLCPAGSVPVLGTDSIAVETKQPVGEWLNYSPAGRGPDPLTVKFKTNAARTLIYRYDPSLPNPVQTSTGIPIYVVTSTGKEGTAVKRVVTEVIAKPFQVLAKGAFVADHTIDYVGNAVVCGYNHRADTPPWTGEDGRDGPAVGTANKPCHGGTVPFKPNYETGFGDLYGSWTSGGTNNGGGAYQNGVPSANVSNQVGFYTGPWDALGIGQPDFYSWVGAPRTAVPTNLNAITYLDNDNTAQNQSGAWSIHGMAGEGMLYVDGDLTLNSTFVYKGLVYIEGDLKLNGQAWILGGLIVRGKADVTMNGGATVLFSSEAILLALSKYGGQFVTLSWREYTN